MYMGKDNFDFGVFRTTMLYLAESKDYASNSGRSFLRKSHITPTRDLRYERLHDRIRSNQLLSDRIKTHIVSMISSQSLSSQSLEYEGVWSLECFNRVLERFEFWIRTRWLFLGKTFLTTLFFRHWTTFTIGNPRGWPM